MSRLPMVLLLACLAAMAGCTALLGPGVEYPAIDPGPATGTPVFSEQTFLFEGHEETVGVSIGANVLAGAKAAADRVLVQGEVPEDEWIAGAYRAQVQDPAQEGFYDDLRDGFREVRDRRGLDGDRYLELVAAAVQQLPYVTAPGSAAKYPVETWADGAGDCDDRALLLAGLLAREGYRVALLVFPGETHMALGVGCPAGYDYGGTGYAYLEVTNSSYVGTVPDDLELNAVPLVVPIGNGTALYGAAPGAGAIEAARRTARSSVDALGPEIERWDAALDVARRSLEVLRTTGNRAAFDAAQEQLVADAAARDRLVDEYNRAAELLERTAASRYDRVGAEAYVSARPP